MGLNGKRTKYNVNTVREAKDISTTWLEELGLFNLTAFGLPEIDDRCHIWRVPIKSKLTKHKVGEVVIDAITTLIDEYRSTKREVLQGRITNGHGATVKNFRQRGERYELSEQRNTVALGDAEVVLAEMAARSVDLIFTSPPYYNARPEYSDFITYEEYLLKMRKLFRVVTACLMRGGSLL